MSQKKLSFLASIFSFSGIYDISAPDPDPIINLVPRKKIKYLVSISQGWK